MKLVPNPEYEQAEYAQGYTNQFGQPVSTPFPELRFREQDMLEVFRLQAAGKPFVHLAVPPHILVTE